MVDGAYNKLFFIENLSEELKPKISCLNIWIVIPY